MNLSHLSVGNTATIEDISGDSALSQRLMSWGVLPGCTLEVISVAPMGDPITISLNGQRISIRKSDATCVQVQPNH
jgi:ferrous iron transport protein A